MIVNQQQLCKEAHKSALNHDPYMKPPSSRLFSRVNALNIEDLRAFVGILRKGRSSCSQPAEEWLLDNAEFIEEQALTIKQELSKKAVNSLPHLRKTNESRIFSICSRDYIKFTDGHLHMDTFLSYIRSYQEVSILTIAEVWAVPMFMRIALIQQLAEIMNTLKERHDICSLVDEPLSNMKQRHSVRDFGVWLLCL